MSNHWQREGEKIPEETVKQLVASRNVNAGLMNRTRDNNYIVRQVFFAMFDLTIHSKELEPNESLNELYIYL